MAESKANYVRRQPQSRKHACHWPGCTRQVPPAMWGCYTHWKMLPQRIREDLWRAYTPGQEVGSAQVSNEYLVAAQSAQRWIAAIAAGRGEGKGQ